VGNWGEEERTRELVTSFFCIPVKALVLKACVYCVRYAKPRKGSFSRRPTSRNAGWLPNYQAPQVFAGFKVTVHVPRRPYVEALPGIPTIRPFEALACGIPLVCAPWSDAEGLFTPGEDYLTARNGDEMKAQLQTVLHDRNRRQALVEHGRATIVARHTCAHRVDELLHIYSQL
jgi:spore maturation protein CgeB